MLDLLYRIGQIFSGIDGRNFCAGMIVRKRERGESSVGRRLILADKIHWSSTDKRIWS